MHDPLKVALSPPNVGGLFQPLHTDYGSNISQEREPIGHLLIDQRSISVDLKDHISVFFEKVKDISTNKRLSP